MLCSSSHILYIVVALNSFLEYYYITEDKILNKQQLLDLLQNLFQQYYSHSLVIEDLVNILRNSGEERSFLRVLIARLAQYDELGRTLAEQLHEFERLNNRLYSMHVKVKGFNIRILYAYLNGDSRVFLHAFFERSDSSKTNYAPAIKKAENRLAELEEKSQ